MVRSGHGGRLSIILKPVHLKHALCAFRLEGRCPGTAHGLGWDGRLPGDFVLFFVFIPHFEVVVWLSCGGWVVEKKNGISNITHAKSPSVSPPT